MTDNTVAKTSKPRTPKTSAELKEQLEKARAALAALEKKAYAEELGELIRNTNIVSDFKAIQAKVTDIKAIAILEAVAQELGISRVTITQAAPPKRKPADPNKPRKPRAKKTEAA